MRLYLLTTLLTFTSTLFLFSLSSQNYIEYQRTFNRIDEDILDSNYSLALQRLDSIYNTYNFIYARHCIKSLQICCKVDDSTRADKFLAKCFRQGVPLWMVRSNELMRKSLNYSTAKYTIAHYDSLHQVYKASINLALARQIDSLFKIDQKRTRGVNDGLIPFRYVFYYPLWRHNNNKQFRILSKIIDKYSFPGERLIGIPSYFEDSSIAAKNIVFYGPSFYDYRAYFMLIHYYSNPGHDINEKLYQNVLTGYLPVSHYASINDFQAENGKNKYGNYSYYNEWKHDPDTSHLPAINQRRATLGMNTFEQQERNVVLNRNWRKANVMGLQIILE